MKRNNPQQRVERMQSAAQEISSILDDSMLQQEFSLIPELHAKLQGMLDSLAKRALANPEIAVIAFAGTSGTGKSSLVNALVGGSLADVGTQRPTTKSPQAYALEESAIDDIAVVLGLENVKRVSAGQAPAGLDANMLLVDLPDLRLVSAEQSAASERVLQQADIIVWATDPQQYADIRWQEEFSRFPHHGNAVVILTHLDLLSETQGETVRQQLLEIMRGQGHHDLPVFTTSEHDLASSYAWGEVLRQLINRSGARWLAMQSSLRQEALALRDVLSLDGENEVIPIPASRQEELLEHIAVACGMEVIESRLRREYLAGAAYWVTWPPLGWLWGLRPVLLPEEGAADAAEEISGQTEPADLVADKTGKAAATGLATSLLTPQEAEIAQRLAKQELESRTPVSVNPKLTAMAAAEYSSHLGAGLPKHWQSFIELRCTRLTLDLTGAMNRGIEAWQPPSRPQRRWWKAWRVGHFLWLAAWVIGAGGLLLQGLYAMTGLNFSGGVLWGIAWPTWLAVMSTLGMIGWDRWGRHLASSGAEVYAIAGQQNFRFVSDEVTRRAFLTPLQESRGLFEKLRELTAQMGALSTRRNGK